MSKITHFSDLRCWQNARKLTSTIYLEDAPLFNRDFATKDQFRRASLSVMNNLAEGFTRFSIKEQIRFYEIAQSSCAEIESMLYLFEDIGYLPLKKIEWYKEQIRFTRNQILAFIKLLHSRK
jgi:four helix bundle protein